MNRTKGFLKTPFLNVQIWGRKISFLSNFYSTVQGPQPHGKNRKKLRFLKKMDFCEENKKFIKFYL